MVVRVLPAFQFHKVRLKDSNKSLLGSSPKFQFHKVRLKGKAEIIGICSHWFQFHKVRLKVLPDKHSRNTGV